MLVTQAYRVEGSVMLFLTTTAIDVDEELVNRCLVLTINESRERECPDFCVIGPYFPLEGLYGDQERDY